MHFSPEHPDFELSPYTGLTRKHWIDAGKYILEGVFRHVKTMDDPVLVPRYETEVTYPNSRTPAWKVQAEYYEGLARSFFIAAPLISIEPDIVIDGKKFSGNAMYTRDGKTFSHGTLMYNVNTDVVAEALRVPKDKIESKGLKSVRSRMTNVKPYVQGDISTREFWERLREFMFQEYQLQPYTLTAEDLAQVERLKEQVYDQWSWNFGASPAYQICKQRRVEGCGKVEIHMDVKDGVIQALAFYGDYFGNGDSGELARRLVGGTLEERDVRARLADADIGSYFNNMDLDTFCSILLE